MTAAIDPHAATPQQPPSATALVVEPVVADALAIATLLEAHHFRVTVAETFAKAKAQLSARPPTVLIAAVRLAEYNGLHLVIRAKSVRWDFPALVTATAPDPVLQADAEAMGATFVVKPVRDNELIAAVLRTIFLPAGLDPIRPPFERRRSDRRVSEMDIDLDRRGGERRRGESALMQIVARN